MHLLRSSLLLPHLKYLFKMLPLILQLPMMLFSFFRLLLSPFLSLQVFRMQWLLSPQLPSHYPSYLCFHLLHCPSPQCLMVKPSSRFKIMLEYL